MCIRDSRWAEGAGRAENVTFRQYGITFRAGALEIARARQAAYDVEFSTCGLDNPDFLVSADRIEIVPEKRIEARGVVVELFRRRVVRLPRLLYRLGAGRAQARQALPVARPGYSQASGFSVAQPIPMGRDFDAEVEPTTRAGLRGRLLYQPEGIPSLYADLAWKQEEGVRDRRPVLVSRMPEVGLRLGRGRRRNLAAGYYREHDTGARSGRLHLEHEVSVLDRGTRPGVSLRLGGRASFYTSGDFYRNVYAEVAVGRGGEDTFEEAGLRLNDIGGDTPFLWDSVQVLTEVFGAKRIALGDYRLEGAVRYDLDVEKIHDLQLAVGRRFSCLEPEIRYSTRSRGFSIGLKVFGIGSRETPTGLEPVTTVRGDAAR